MFLFLIVSLCTACYSFNNLSDYPELNKEVNIFMDEIKNSEYFNDIIYDGFKVIKEEEVMYDIFYSTNCSNMTISYSDDYKFGWFILKKKDVCGESEEFSKDIWNNQVEYLFSLKRFNISENSFLGQSGDTWEDYKNLMSGNSDKIFVTADNGIMISYDPKIYLLGIFDTNI